MPSTTSSASYFPEEEHFPNERQIGFWKSESPADNYGYKPFASSPFGKFISVESQTVGTVGHLEQYGSQAKKMNLGLERRAVGSEMAAARPFSLWGHVDHDPAVKSNANAQSIPYSAEGVKISMLGTHYENGLFSSSLSDLFSRKLRIPVNSALYGHSADTAAPHCDEDEPFESLDEIEAQTIGNLLPDDDDLLSGVTDGLVQPGNGDDIEDLDLFSSVGGLDLGEDGSSVGQKSSKSGEIPNGHLGSLIGEHPNHPSRTLFIRNVNSSIDDSELQTLFEQYGDIHTLYTACKHRGFVMVSYYDLRAAQKAMPALQSKPLRGRKLDIHFSVPKDNPSEKDINQGNLVVFNLDSSVSNGELCQIFGVYGDIKEIWDTPHRSHHKVIEFYDIRAAEAALHALNTSDVAGNRIKLEPSHTSGGMSLMQQFHPDVEQEQYLCQGSPPTNSTIGFSGSVPRGKISSGSLDNGTNLSVDAAIQAVYSSPTGNPFYHGISCSVPNGLPSLDKVKLAGNQSAQAESKRTHGQLKVDYQGAGSPQPHSLPEYQDALSNDMSGNSLASLAAKISPASSKKFLNGQFYRASRNGHQMELKQDAYGSSGNGNCPLPGHHYAWSNSNQPRSSTMMWPNSPTFPNGMCTIHPPPQPHGHPSHPSHMANPVLSINNNHVGSAPTVKPSLWDRRNAYAGESLEASGFHPASFGNMRMAPNSLHSLEFVPHGIFPHVGGNRMELPISPNNIGLHSHQSRCQIFPGRGQMVSVMSSFDSPNERVRGRRGDSSSNQPENKRQYELDLDRIMRGEDKRTTLMIKNIPNKYTSKMLLAAIDERHRGTYDFIYLPIDFKNKCNVGYAFINMTDPKHIISFYQTFNGKKWEKFNSEKVASLAYARIQGKIALIAHFQNSSLMNEDKRCRPILFHTEGPNAGDQVPFPMGVNIRPRPNKTRSSANEENHLANVEGCSSGDSCSGSIKDSD